MLDTSAGASLAMVTSVLGSRKTPAGGGQGAGRPEGRAGGAAARTTSNINILTHCSALGREGSVSLRSKVFSSTSSVVLLSLERIRIPKIH